MQYSQLFRPGMPCIYLHEANTADVDLLSENLTKYRKSGVIRKVRGDKSESVSGFFDEISAALQFPLYFGENWNAFNDCITDLDWLEGDSYILLISNAVSLLSEANHEDFRILVKMLTIANEEWVEPNKYIPRNRPPTAFHVVFQCTTSDIAVVTGRLEQINADFAILKLQ